MATVHTASAPACLEPDDLDDYRAGVLTGCRDCTVAFSADMTARNRCNGIPGEVTAGIAQEEPMDQPGPIAARSTTRRVELEVAAPPCASCADESICSLRLAVEGIATVETAAPPLPAGLRLSLVAAVDCAHFLGDRAKPAPARALTSQERGQANGAAAYHKEAAARQWSPEARAAQAERMRARNGQARAERAAAAS